MRLAEFGALSAVGRSRGLCPSRSPGARRRRPGGGGASGCHRECSRRRTRPSPYWGFTRSNVNERTGDPRLRLRDEGLILPSRPATLRAAWLFSGSFEPFETPTGRRRGGGSKGTRTCSSPGERCSWPRCPQCGASGGRRACFRPPELQAIAFRYRTISQSQAPQSSHEAGVGAVYPEWG